MHKQVEKQKESQYSSDTNSFNQNKIVRQNLNRNNAKYRKMSQEYMYVGQQQVKQLLGFQNITNDVKRSISSIEIGRKIAQRKGKIKRPCLSSLEVDNIKEIKKDNKVGHEFDAIAKYKMIEENGENPNLPDRTQGLKDERFEWNEKTNLPAFQQIKKNEWVDMRKSGVRTNYFEPWNAKSSQYDMETVIVKIHDDPQITFDTSENKQRTLEFNIVFSDDKGKTLNIIRKQELNVENGEVKTQTFD